jgi:hypothetical protein
MYLLNKNIFKEVIYEAFPNIYTRHKEKVFIQKFNQNPKKENWKNKKRVKFTILELIIC